MKKIFYILLIFIGFNGISFADEIYLNDLSIIKGKIIQVTEKNVEYSQENKPFLIVPRNLVFKIKYDNGQVVQLADAATQDKIFLKDGSVIEGTIVKVTPDVIMYTAADKQEAVVRDNVLKIVYSNGKIVQISEAPVNETAVEKLPEKEEEPVIRTGGFIDSYIWLGMFLGISDVYGNIENKEDRIYNEHKASIPGYYSYPEHNVDYTGGHFGFDLNLMFPSIKFKQIRGFDLTGLKFGLKTTYVFSNITQSITEYYSHDDDYSGDTLGEGTLLRYRSVNAGPEINLVFSPKTDFFNMVVQFYTLGGYIHNGKLTAAPAIRDAGTPVTESYTADFTGYSFTAGVGHYFVFNRMVPITLGYGFFYSYSKIEFDRNVPIYNGAKNSSFDEFGFTLSIGTHFWGAE